MVIREQGESIGRRLSWRHIFRYEWDRVGFHFCSIAFGIWSVGLTLGGHIPPGTPDWLIAIALVFDVSFLVVGTFLFSALRNGSYRMRVQGYSVYVGALVMLAGLLFVVSRSPYCVLALAFAFQGLNAIRMMREKHHAILVVQRVVEEDRRRGMHGPE